MKNEYSVDNLGWIRLGPHKWKHLKGYIIQRNWTLAGKKKKYFLFFLTEDLYYAGCNVSTFTCLGDAKTYFTDLVPLSPDLNHMK